MAKILLCCIWLQFCALPDFAGKRIQIKTDRTDFSLPVVFVVSMQKILWSIYDVWLSLLLKRGHIFIIPCHSVGRYITVLLVLFANPLVYENQIYCLKLYKIKAGKKVLKKLCFIEALLSQFNCQRQRNLYISLNNPFFHSPTFKCQCIKNIHSRKSPPPFTCAFLSQKDQNGIRILSISRLLPRHIVTWVPKEEKNIGMALARMMGSNGPTVSGHFLCKISHPYHVWIVLPLNNQSNQCSRNKSNTYLLSISA